MITQARARAFLGKRSTLRPARRLEIGSNDQPKYNQPKEMTDYETKLLQILSIAHEASLRGAGISLRDALIRTGYRDLRPYFEPTDLMPIIKSQPKLVDQWIAYDLPPEN